LGLQLVCALTEQLQGIIAAERDGGTALTVTFPLAASAAQHGDASGRDGRIDGAQ
jgi:two-component sensor histidine kinase